MRAFAQASFSTGAQLLQDYVTWLSCSLSTATLDRIGADSRMLQPVMLSNGMSWDTCDAYLQIASCKMATCLQLRCCATI
jgi:hypothetical protein